MRPSRCVVVFFRRGEVGLGRGEFEVLQRWVQAWRPAERPCDVLVGCCADTPRDARCERLRVLVTQLVQCGVPRASIRSTDAWGEPAWRESAMALPQDVAWLEVVDVSPRGREAMPDAGTRASPANPPAGPAVRRA